MMAWKVEGSCFIQAGGKAVAGGLATGGVAAPAAGVHPLPTVPGSVGVDGAQADVALAKFLAQGVDALGTGAKGNVVVLRYEDSGVVA